jgi:hypothetical protein
MGCGQAAGDFRNAGLADSAGSPFPAVTPLGNRNSYCWVLLSFIAYKAVAEAGRVFVVAKGD